MEPLVSARPPGLPRRRELPSAGTRCPAFGSLTQQSRERKAGKIKYNGAWKTDADPRLNSASGRRRSRLSPQAEVLARHPECTPPTPASDPRTFLFFFF